MSTKSTIKYGDNFHFYRDCFDDDNFHLEIDNAEISQSGRQVTLTIPKSIWAVISNSAEVKLDFAKLTNNEILDLVTTEVDKRIAEFEAETDENARTFLGFVGMFIYGLANEDRDIQIKNGVEYYVSNRKRERKILKQINKYKRENS